MTVALADMALPAGLVRVRGLYDGLVADRSAVEAAGTADPMLAVAAATFLAAECRWLDVRSFARWLSAWTDDGLYWVPLDANGHPAEDQALFLDDRRRLGERVWRMSDASAWALTPPAATVRLLGSVEAWQHGDDLLTSSALQITYRRGARVMTLAARQIHRLAPVPPAADGAVPGSFAIRRKILLIPELRAGLPHLGWLL